MQRLVRKMEQLSILEETQKALLVVLHSTAHATRFSRSFDPVCLVVEKRKLLLDWWYYSYWKLRVLSVLEESPWSNDSPSLYTREPSLRYHCMGFKETWYVIVNIRMTWLYTRLAQNHSEILISIDMCEKWFHKTHPWEVRYTVPVEKIYHLKPGHGVHKLYDRPNRLATKLQNISAQPTSHIGFFVKPGRKLQAKEKTSLCQWALFVHCNASTWQSSLGVVDSTSQGIWIDLMVELTNRW